MKKYAILLLLIGLTATFANAQFPIKIPKIKIPKIEQPKPRIRRNRRITRRRRISRPQQFKLSPMCKVRYAVCQNHRVRVRTSG